MVSFWISIFHFVLMFSIWLKFIEEYSEITPIGVFLLLFSQIYQINSHHIFWILCRVHSVSRSSVTYHHVTPEHTTHLPVHISYPNTTRTHPTARGMSGHLRKNFISQYFRTLSRTVGYLLYLGSTSDDTTCFIIAHSYPYAFMIFYLMLFITIFLDLFHLKHSFSIYTYLCLSVTSVWISTSVSASSLCLTQLSK